MKIGIISDTHTKVKMAKEALNLLIENGAEFIVHAGDIVEVEILEMLKKCGVRYIAVYGNNDAHLAQYHGKYNLVQEPHYFKLANLKFKLMHMPYYMAPDADIVLFGHTHEFEIDFKNGTLFLNPGEVCARNKSISECAMLEVTDVNFEVTYYTREKKEKTFKHQKFLYERVKS
ncbi:YfcE family phosphodiesterase [Sulfurimonas sp. CS5]|jgi:putative phosphoesterase|uniref:YfcE family phosphodiesterase n=1 Tax=Sulfurimonas sp. CS5 TaxID=3391145 RepID=UPI0039ED54AF